MALPFLKSHPKASPNDRIKELSGRGFAESEMIDILRKEGYAPSDIDVALTSTMASKVTDQSQQNTYNQPPQTSYTASEPTPSPWTQAQPQPKRETVLPTLEEITEKRPSALPQIPETSIPAEYYQQSYLTEEYVDYVIQARMGEYNQKLTEFSVKTQDLGKRIEEVSDRINEIMSLRNAEQTQILSKIDTFKDSVGGIDTRIGSLEKAFKETLPALIESVRALTDLVQRLKREM